MKISTKGRYALRMLLDLVNCPKEEFIALKDIAARQGISKKYLEQIVPVLNRAGILSTGRGFQGGYRLAVDPSTLTVGDILRLTEGNLAPVECLYSAENTCPRREGCPTLEVWKGLTKVINEYVDGITLEQLANQGKEAGKYDYII